MKKYRITGILWLLVAIQAPARFNNYLGGAVQSASGSAIKAFGGVANANGGTLTDK